MPDDQRPATTEAEPPTASEAVPRPTVNIDFSRFRLSTVVIATIAVLGILLAAYVIYRSLLILFLVFVAILLATAIEPAVNWLRKGPFNRTTGILVVYTGIFVFLLAVGYVTVPIVLQQAGEMGTSLRRTVNDLRQSVDQLQNPFIRQQARVFIDVASSVVGQVENPEASTPDTDTEKVQAVTQTTTVVAEIFFAIITIFVVAFYWLTERTLIKRGVMSWFTPKRANRIRRVWDDIEVKVGGWVRGQLVLMATVGVLSAIGYFFIGVKFWPALALFIAIAEAIPLVGPYIGTAPAVLVALTQGGNDGFPALIGMGDIGSLTRALLVVMFAIVLQTIEGNVLVPRVMKNSVGISPLAVILSILLGATLAGLAGALVAVPLAGALQVILQDLQAAREGEQRLEELTEQAEQVRQEAGELVVAYPEGSETVTRVEGTR
jgi:predicted PurR-regulated permease PerM